jgi:hypothetical protein
MEIIHDSVLHGINLKLPNPTMMEIKITAPMITITRVLLYWGWATVLFSWLMEYLLPSD